MKVDPQKPLSRRQIVKGAVAAGVTALAAPVYGRIASSPRRPNIVFLLADDLRFDGVGYTNKDVSTPNLDQLAGEGVRFRNMFVTTAICCSSRASIFTGAYARRHGVWDFTTNLSSHLLNNSYPALLKAAGYRTGFFGKYGVGDYKTGDDMGDGTGPMPQVPAENAACFDDIEDFDRYYAPGDSARAHHNNDMIAEKAEKFIRGSSAAQPFCLSLSFKAPHVSEPMDLLMGPYTAEPDLLELYSETILTEGPVVIDEVGIDAAGGWDIFTQPAAAKHAAAFNGLPEYLRRS
jgi:arylsulfatase A-like enzyme